MPLSRLARPGSNSAALNILLTLSSCTTRCSSAATASRSLLLYSLRSWTLGAGCSAWA